MGEENMRMRALTGFVFAVGFLAGIGLAASANAETLRTASTNQGADVTGAKPGPVLFTDYTTGVVDEPIYPGTTASAGDTVIRLVNPNGSANPGIVGGTEHTVCAMIYVFDDEQEMNACCGCPISSAGLLTLSLEDDLLSNLIVGGNPRAGFDGVVEIIAAAPNGCGSLACTYGCDPTLNPGYTVTPDNNLLGSRVINISNEGYPTFGPASLLETPLHDDASGDAGNLTYVQAECGALVGNGSYGGICYCPSFDRPL
jgi:hypothetical protein